GDSSGETNGTGTNNDSGSSDEEVTIAETVLYEADGIKVTAKSLADGLLGTEVKLLIENDSSKNILITSSSVSANGYMMPTAALYAEVAAGKKANESLTLMSSELDQCGIETLAEMQFYLQIQDPETWETIKTTDLITLATSATGYTQPVDDSGDVLYNENGYKVVCKGLKQDIIWDGTVVFYMENNSSKAVSIYAENVSVNGFMQEVGLWSDLRPSTKMIDGMSMIDLSDMEITNIDEIKTIEFNLRIVDAETWEDIVTTDAMTLNFE
nr:hypothetical protein [Lachnospiraceae bacterium]